ncbi:hypothetical protein [Streptomyces chartreusis]|uniref:Uncharacterized protein n=1 Tax=Streptomyces chartreusis TaxID=1969 RepID=A0A7H8T9Z8_STRCX|nr:hypothetical protein [Streptomyces chartreusis]QKZ20306.1 hypothetical protein HUT05_24915 [Streptomyces chartreusis]
MASTNHAARPAPDHDDDASACEAVPFDPLAFPADLVKAQRALVAAYAALHAFTTAPGLPWAVEPGGGWDDSGTGLWRETKRPGTDGWTDEQRSEHARLWAEVRRRAIEVSCAPHWEAVRAHCSPQDVVEARQALKQAALKTLDVPQAA